MIGKVQRKRNFWRADKKVGKKMELGLGMPECQPLCAWGDQGVNNRNTWPTITYFSVEGMRKISLKNEKSSLFHPAHLGFVCPERVVPCSGAILWLQWCCCALGCGSAWLKVLDPCPVLLGLPYLIWQKFSSAGCSSALGCVVLTPFLAMDKESLQSSSVPSVLLYI